MTKLKSRRDGLLQRTQLKNCEYELVILDEANIALDLGLIDLEDMLETLKNKPKGVEIVLTGRNANKKLIEWHILFLK